MGIWSRHLLTVLLSTLLLSGVATWFANRFLGTLPLFPGFLILLAVIIIGIAFDIIGTAATAATVAPLHAAATDRVDGSKQAVRLVNASDRVANFTNDLIGDIAGTVSGAVAIALAFRISPGDTFLSTMIVALTAALTVTGKAWGKEIAIKRAELIMMWVGRQMARIERWTGVSLLKTGKDNKEKRRNAKQRGPRK